MIDVLFAFQALRRHFKSPGEDDRHREAQDQEKRECGINPAGQIQGRGHHLASLHDQPADNNVGGRHLDDIPALEFFKKTHETQLSGCERAQPPSAIGGSREASEQQLS